MASYLKDFVLYHPVKALFLLLGIISFYIAKRMGKDEMLEAFGGLLFLSGIVSVGFLTITYIQEDFYYKICQENKCYEVEYGDLLGEKGCLRSSKGLFCGNYTKEKIIRTPGKYRWQ